MSEAFPGTVDISDIVPALLDFERMPGRYRLALREPSLLFEQTHAVMLLAAGRQVKGMPPLGEGAEAAAAQKAARYFVRMVLLRAGSDHYTLLGLKPHFEPDTLRDHYRLMIRLTHPDFSTPGEEWPADAASRINLANDVLGSSVKRSLYNEALKAEKATISPVNAAASSAPLPRQARAPNGAHGPRGTAIATGPRGYRSAPDEAWSFRTKMVLGAFGALACIVGIVQLTPSGHEDSLVAKADRAVLPAVASISKAPVEEPQPSLPKSRELLPAPIEKSQTLAATPAVAVAALPSATPPVPLLPSSPVRVPPKAKQIELPSPSPAVLETAPDDRRVAVSAPISTQLTAERTLATPAQLTPTTAAASTIAGATAPAADTVTSVAAAAPPAGVSPAPAPSLSPPALTLADVQPKLAVIMAALDRGRYDLAMEVLDPAWNNREARIEFLKGYFQFLQGQKVGQLNGASFRSRSTESGFLVNGVLTISLKDAADSSVVRDLHIKAAFVRKNGKPILTRIEASPGNP